MDNRESVSHDQASSCIRYEEDEGLYKIDGEVVLEEDPSTCLVMSVAEIADADPLEQPQLSDAIDPEALDELFRTGIRSEGSDMDKASFNYADYRVTLYRDGELLIQPRNSSGTGFRTGGPA